MKIKERIKLLLKDNSVSITRLAGGNGTALQASLNRQINGDTGLSAETVSCVLSAFPSVSAEWLLRGEGDMYKPGTRVQTRGIVGDANIIGTANTADKASKSAVNNGYNAGDMSVNNTVNDNTELVAALRAQIADLQKQLDFVNGIVKTLTEQRR